MSCFPAGFGVGVIFQILPFQTSARVRSLPDFVTSPAATHDVFEAHETASRKPLLISAGAGVFWIAQPSPFQCSAIGTWLTPFDWLPTASQEAAAEHEIPLMFVLFGLGMIWEVQLVPSQC